MQNQRVIGRCWQLSKSVSKSEFRGQKAHACWGLPVMVMYAFHSSHTFSCSPGWLNYLKYITLWTEFREITILQDSVFLMAWNNLNASIKDHIFYLRISVVFTRSIGPYKGWVNLLNAVLWLWSNMAVKSLSLNILLLHSPNSFYAALR